MESWFILLSVLFSIVLTLSLPFAYIYKFVFLLIILIISYFLTIINQNFLHEKFSKYYFWFVDLVNRLFGTKFHSTTYIEVDENLIPYCVFGYRHGKYIGEKRNPLHVANYLLDYIKEKNKEGIKSTSEWLIKNCKKRKGFIIWEMNYKRPQYGLDKNWVSGFYQGRILKSLYKLYENRGEKKYLDLVLKGLKAFEIDLDDGGLRIEGDKGYWYPEYGQKNKKCAYVLNGMIYTLLDLHYLYKKTEKKKIKKLFDKGIKEVLEHLKKYDSGNWTYYDRIGNKARYDYHLLHIEQMKELYKITKNKKFKEYAEKWSGLKYLINLPDKRFYPVNVIILSFLVFLSIYLMGI